MNLARTLSLNVTATLVAMAFFTAGSASADVMCMQAHTSPCPEEQVWKGPVQGLSINDQLEAGVATILFGSFEVHCTSTFLAQNLASLGAHNGILGLVHSLTFTSCAGSCSAVEGGKAANAPYHVLGLATPGHLLVKDHGSGTFLFSLTGCTIFNVTCSYKLGSGAILLSIKLDELIASKVPLVRHAGSGICAEKIAWDVVYLLETDLEATPRPLFLALEG